MSDLSLYYKNDVDRILKVLHINWISPEERVEIVKIIVDIITKDMYGCEDIRDVRK